MNSPQEGKSAITWLTGQFLIAMPCMQDPRFERTVTLICSHGPDGAMGLVVNRLFGDLQFSGLISQFDVSLAESVPDRPIHYGGPVDPVRGFVLHSAEYKRDGTNRVTENVSLTATVEILRDIASGVGPQRYFTALGYAGWGAGQLEGELKATGWLTAPLDEDVLFDLETETKWARVYDLLGISPALLVADAGHA